MTPVRLEPAALQSRVKRSTNEPLRSLFLGVQNNTLCIDEFFLQNQNNIGFHSLKILANSKDPMKCRVMQHFIRVFNICQRSRLEVTLQRVYDKGLMCPTYDRSKTNVTCGSHMETSHEVQRDCRSRFNTCMGEGLQRMIR